ncbi:MAG: GntR family transcriptional regulator [Propionibacteriaceae bacterium]|nr:GntR family transcriptional regulator [Propionibacteriaceae bacterium]
MVDLSSRDLADLLADEIRPLPVGTRIMSEHQIMGRFGVTRAVARGALDHLASRYLVRRTQGAGTFVHRRLDYVISRDRAPSLHQEAAASGWSTKTFVLGAEPLPPPDLVATKLGTGSLPCTRLQRLAYLDDAVSTLLTEWIAPGIADHVEVGLAVFDSLDELLRGLRWSPERRWCRVTVDEPPDHVRTHLDLESEAQAWHVTTLSVDASSGRPLFVSSNWTRLDLVRFVCEL